MSEFHFLRPFWLLALLPAAMLLVLLWRRRAQAGSWQALVAPALLAHLLLDARPSLRRAPLLLLGLGWLLAIVALAGPVWQRQPQPAFRAPLDRVIVLDMSPSMAAADLKPDRLSRARVVIRELLAPQPEGRTALVVFGAEPHVVTPLTDDTATIEALLPALAVDILPVSGDQAAPALRLAGTLLARVGSRHGAALLLTDGSADPADSLAAVRELHERGITVSVVGVGTVQGAPVPAAAGGFASGADGKLQLARLDEAGLRALASTGGGHYQRIDAVQVQQLFDRHGAHDVGQPDAAAKGVERWVEQGPWLLLPLLLLAAAGFRRGWLAVLVLLVLPPPPAHAFGWQDLWLRPDQQASRLLQQGDAKSAAARFNDPHWRATAQYQAGDYSAAAQSFSGDGADAAYNRGNALARAGQLQEALAAYDAALQRQPDHADARFNRELVDNLLRAQQSPASQQSAQDQPQDISRQQSSSGQGQSQQQSADGQGASQQQSADGQGPSQTQPSAGQEQASSGQHEQSQAGAQSQPAQGAGAGGQDAQAQAEPDQDEHAEAGKSGKQNDTQQKEAGKDTGSRAHPAPADGGTQDAAGQQAPPPASITDGKDAARQAPAASNTAAADAQSAAQPDSAAQARADVDPDSTPPQAPAAAMKDSAKPQSEQDIAMQQWLRQVPDDPSGLLRRKFMVEHLLRQKGQLSQ